MGNILNSFFNSTNPQMIFSNMLVSVVNYLPRLISSIMIFFIGKIVSGYVAEGLAKIITALNLRKIIDSFELGISLTKENERGLAGIIGLIGRYVALYFTFIVIFDLLGLPGISIFLQSIATILPRLISATVIILLGVIIAGLVESLVKKAVISIDPATARLSGKISSYIVVGFFILMGLAELGVASFFINTLFIGFIASLSLAFGLALGLGSKDLVVKSLEKWSRARKKKAL